MMKISSGEEQEQICWPRTFSDMLGASSPLEIGDSIPLVGNLVSEVEEM